MCRVPEQITSSLEETWNIKLQPNGKDVFVASEVNFDELYYQGRNPKLLSSLQLVKRIRHPATGSVTVRQQSLALHSRVTM